LATQETEKAPEHLQDEIIGIMERVRDSELAFFDMQIRNPLIEQMIALSRDGDRIWIEDPAKGVWAPWGQAFLRMVPDMMFRIGKTGILEDDKSGWNRNPDPLQLAIYAYGASKLFAGMIETVSVRFNFLRFGYREYAQFNLEQLEAVGNYIRSTADNIQKIIDSGVCEPNIDAGRCDWCGFTNDSWLDKDGNPVSLEPCPALLKLLGEMDMLVEAYKTREVKGLEDAQANTRSLVIGKALFSQMEKDLAAFVKENPEPLVVAAGKKAVIAKKATLKIPDLEAVVRELLEALYNSGMPEEQARAYLWQRVSLGKSELEKIEKKAPGVTRRLEEAGLIAFKEGEEFKFLKV